ncbi:MAG: hypothetical protein KI786_07460 [Mameliella sp.]|nr:hypothetical protein [Phaeodactylibacter sp.]
MTVVPMGSVRELGYNEKDKTFDIKYDKGGKNKKVSVLLDDISLREAIVEEIAALKEMQKEVKEESKTQPLLYNLLGVVLIPVFTWVMRDMAIDAQNGEHYVASGRKSGAKQLVANLVETIGPMGVTLIGIAGLAFMIYKTYNRYQNPAAEIQYQLK